MLSLALLAWAVPREGQAAERKLETQLVWATDGLRPTNSAHRPVEQALEKKLKSIPLKYKSYFEIRRVPFTINDRQYTKVPISQKCYLEVKDKGENRVTVKLYGEGKFVKRLDSPLPKGETVVIAGDDKNGTAWLVVVYPGDAKGK